MAKIDDLLRDENKVNEAMKKIAKEEITERMESATEVFTNPIGNTNYEELD